MEKEKEIILSEFLPFWKMLSGEQKTQILNFSVKNSFKERQVMYEGEECDGLFLVLNGRIRAYVVSDMGKEITLFRLLEKDICIFSASCIIKNINFNVHLKAEEDTDVFIISAAVYKKISQENASAAGFINQLLGERMSDVMWIMEQVLFMSFDKRLSIFLLEQSNLEQRDSFNMTHEEIANHLGSAREVVSRMLKYFAEEELVSMSRGKITIINKEKLMEITKK